jgi:branched-chain amino acid aminotransferase
MVEALNITIKKVSRSNLPNIDFSKIVFGKVYSDHMFMAEYVNGEWSNYSILPYGNLNLSPSTCALHYGQSVFEGLKAYKNRDGAVLVFRPQENFKRMNLSAKRICMPEIPEDVFMGGLTELLRIDRDWVPEIPGTSLYLRPFMFATDEYIGLKPSMNYRFVLFTCPVGPYYSEPLKVKVEDHFVRAFPGGTGSSKVAGNYAGSLYPAKLAQQEGYHQLIWTDGMEHRYVEESGTMNLIFVIDDVLVTPTLDDDTILHGITRDSVLTIARDWGMKVEERRVSIDEIIEAIKKRSLREAFGAGTAATIAHIKTIGYEGVDYELPPVTHDLFSRKVLDTLEKYRKGLLEDKFGWIVKIS